MRTFAAALAFGIGVSCAASAMAQETHPCSRDGIPPGLPVDLAQIRCQNAFWQQKVGELMADLVSSRAAAAVAREDLQTAREHSGDVDKWWRGYVNPAPAAAPATAPVPAPAVPAPAKE